jgi:membrane protein YdbS with pleckstrin-like domain
MSIYPDADKLLENTNESQLLVMHRSIRSLWPLIGLFTSFVLLHYLLNYYLDDSRMRWLAILPALCLLETVRRFYNDRFIFERHRITHEGGRLWFSYNVPVIKYIDIRAISVSQDIWGRMLGFGNLELSTAAHEGTEITILGVRNPGELAAMLEKLRRRSRQYFLKSDASSGLNKEIESVVIHPEDDEELAIVRENSKADELPVS